MHPFRTPVGRPRYLVVSGSVLPLLALSVILGGCDTETTIKEVPQQCSAATPYGACDAGESCMQGTCVADDARCGANNLEGSCPSGEVCFAGGCIPANQVCGAANPVGPCVTGQTCRSGTCVALADLCSATNTSGMCDEGLTCQGGECKPSVVDECTQHVYMAPIGEIVTHGEITATASAFTTLNAVVAGNTLTLGFCPSGTTYPCATGVQFTGVAPDATPTEIQFKVGRRTTGTPPVEGPDDQVTADNLAAAINAHPTGSALVTAVASVVDPTATNLTYKITFTAKTAGALGNGIGIGGTNARFVASTSSGATAGGVGTGKQVITVGGLQFRDMNGDGALQPYEDWRLSAWCRAKDAVSRLPNDQKFPLLQISAGGFGGATADGSLSAQRRDQVLRLGIRTSMMGALNGVIANIVRTNNNLQELCEASPLGLPFVFTGDPSHFIMTGTNSSSGNQVIGSWTTGSLPGSALGPWSAWPMPLGIAGTRDTTLAWKFGDTARKEYKALGIRMHYGPMADTATEPRWNRIQNLYGESAQANGKMVRATIEGFQGSANGDCRDGVATTIKHFPGSGTVDDGKDSHGYNGRYSVFPGNNLQYSLQTFEEGFKAKPAAMMPCYSVYLNQFQYDPLQVPSGFSYGFMTGLAKNTYGWDGLITADWGTLGHNYASNAALSLPQRAALWFAAGSHQMGSDSYTSFIQAFDQGLITQAQLDHAAAKFLELMFKTGSAENPYVDLAAAEAIVGGQEAELAGLDAQKRVMVLLRNNGNRLPISGVRGTTAGGVHTYFGDVAGAGGAANGPDGVVKVYYDGVVDALSSADRYSTKNILPEYNYASAADPATTPRPTLAVESTATLADADIAVLRINARPGYYFGLDAGVPLSFDAPFPGTSADAAVQQSIRDRNKVIDLFRARDGYTRSDGTVVPAVNPNLKIVLVMFMWRPGIVKPFINGLRTLDETSGVAGSYPLVSNEANVNPTIVTTTGAAGHAGVDAFVADFGAYDRAVLDFIFNRNAPIVPGVATPTHGTARLSIEIPSTDAEVNAQYEDMPFDTPNPTYTNGSGSNMPN